jgi:hypothetical protein
MSYTHSPDRLNGLMARFSRALRGCMAKYPERFTDEDRADPDMVVDRVRNMLTEAGFHGITVRGSLTWPLVARQLGLPPTAKALGDYLKGL